MTQLDPITVTIPEASRLTNLSVTTLYAKIRTGALQSTTVGKRRLIFFRSLVEMMQAGTSMPSDTRPNWTPPSPLHRRKVEEPAPRRFRRRAPAPADAA